MNRQPASKWRWRIMRWGLICGAVLVTLIAMLVTEENWRQKRAWESYKREAETRGERFDMASVVPPAVPDDQNFFSAPVVVRGLGLESKEASGILVQDGTNDFNPLSFSIYRGSSGNWPQNGGAWQKGTLTSLAEWQRYFRTLSETEAGRTNGFPVPPQPRTPAADILISLSVYDPMVEELREASRRPYARLPLAYENGFDVVSGLLPDLAAVKRCGQFLGLRSLAELENGQNEKALEDVELMLRVTDSLRDQPYLISHLVHIAMLTITLQPVYEGMARHQWSDAQLAELDKILADVDVLADFEAAMEGEKIFAVESLEKERITGEIKTTDGSSGTNQVITVSMRGVPNAYFYGNELAFARMHDQLIAPLVDVGNRTVAVAVYRRGEATMKEQQEHYSPYAIQAAMTFPAVAKTVVKFAAVQTDIDLARIASALERYRLEHNEYPATLDVLAPQFMASVPHDLINGQPLHYRRTGDGKFVLYSIGWNEQDDGGVVAFAKDGRLDSEKGDWVWKY